MDTLPRGTYPWVCHTVYLQCRSEYAWNPWILCQGEYPCVYHTMYACPMLVRVSMESTDTLPSGVSMSWPCFVYSRLVRVSMESIDTLLRDIHWFNLVGHTMYVCPMFVGVSVNSFLMGKQFVLSCYNYAVSAIQT